MRLCYRGNQTDELSGGVTFHHISSIFFLAMKVGTFLYRAKSEK